MCWLFRKMNVSARLEMYHMIWFHYYYSFIFIYFFKILRGGSFRLVRKQSLLRFSTLGPKCSPCLTVLSVVLFSTVGLIIMEVVQCNILMPKFNEKFLHSAKLQYVLYRFKRSIPYLNNVSC